MTFGACLGRLSIILRVPVLLGNLVKVLVASERRLQAARLLVGLAEHEARLALQLPDLTAPAHLVHLVQVVELLLVAGGVAVRDRLVDALQVHARVLEHRVVPDGGEVLLNCALFHGGQLRNVLLAQIVQADPQGPRGALGELVILLVVLHGLEERTLEIKEY